MIKLSIVTTLYSSAPYIEEFYERATTAAQSVANDEYELVFVNDGSPDDSLQMVVEIAERDSHVTVVDLSRNFGHHKAMMTGLAQSRGERVFLIDSDLEEEPEYLQLFLDEMDAHECDVVYGVQEVRKGGWFERWTGRAFYGVFKTLTGLHMPENIVTARLMSRRYVDALTLHDEREVFMAGLWFITGFVQRPYAIKKHSHSETTYTLRKKLSLLVNSVTSFSNMPLKMIFYIGVAISSLSAAYITYLVVNWFFWATPVSGWTSVMASIWLLGGMVISFVGVIGIYLSKIFSEVKRRPYTIIRKIYGQRTE